MNTQPSMLWRNKRFGPAWDAPSCEYADLVATPVGEPCLECEEPILDGDRGMVMPFVGAWSPMHLECYMRGTMSHSFKQCRCYVPRRSLREEAKATLEALNAERAKQGWGPL
jgi:hypothetical protein